MTRSLREQARDMDSVRPHPTTFGLYSMRIEGRTLQIQQQALDDLRRQFRAAILTGIRPIEVRIAGGRSRHESMNEIRSDQFIVSRISDVLGRVDWPSMSIWRLPEQWMQLVQTCLRENMYERAVIALENAERTSAQASRTLHNAIEGTISGAGRAVTTLEITRDVSVATAGILATVATGGVAGVAISTAIGTTTTLAQQGMEVHLGLRDRIDWEGITVQTAVGLVTGRFGGQLGNKITARLMGNPAFASASRRVVSELVGDLTAGKTSAALQMAVTNLYNNARGRPDAMNMDQFLDALAAQLTDPRSTFMDMAMGRVARRAAAGAPAQAPKQKPPAAKQQQTPTAPQPTPAAETSTPKVPPPVRPTPKRTETRLVDSSGRPLSPRPTRPQLVDAQGQPIRRSTPKHSDTGLVDSSGRPLSHRPTRPQLVDAQGQPIRRPTPKRGDTGLVDPAGRPVSSQRPTPSGGKQQAKLPKGEEAFGELNKELGLEKTGTTKVPKRKNVHPDFEAIPANLQGVAKAQVNTLSQQLNLKLPQDRVLSAPWVGRVRDAKGKPTSAGTSAGWLRNESRFWKEFKARFPDDYALIGKGHTVTPELAQKYGWDKSHIGDKLVHHHINNGSYVVAIPEKLHHKLSGTIHAKPTIMGE